MTIFTTGELKVFFNILIQGGHVLDLNSAEFRQIILSNTGIDVSEKNYETKVSEEMGSSYKCLTNNLDFAIQKGIKEGIFSIEIENNGALTCP